MWRTWGTRPQPRPVYDDIKKEGMISDYKAWTNVTSDSPGDWDIAVGLMFPNWAAIDQLDAKAATISAKHYGSRDAMIKRARNAMTYARS
jgi:hypothetical protein